MKTDRKMTPMRAAIEGEVKRPRRIVLETMDGSPMPVMDDRRYMPVNGSLVPYEPQQHPNDGTKTVRISEDAYKRLRNLRQRGETVSQAMERMIYESTA